MYTVTLSVQATTCYGSVPAAAYDQQSYAIRGSSYSPTFTLGFGNSLTSTDFVGSEPKRALFSGCNYKFSFTFVDLAGNPAFHAWQETLLGAPLSASVSVPSFSDLP